MGASVHRLYREVSEHMDDASRMDEGGKLAAGRDGGYDAGHCEKVRKLLWLEGQP